MSPEEFVDMLGSVESRTAAAKMRGPLVDAGREVNRAVAGNFQRQENSRGVAWAPHAPLTIAIHGPHDLLRLSYDMFHAATNMDDANAKRRVSDNEILFGIDGTELPYAIEQQEGHGRIPAREFFYLRDRDAGVVEEAFAQGAIVIIENEVFG